MHHQFNIQQLYALPTLYLCVLYLSENKQRLVPLNFVILFDGFFFFSFIKTSSISSLIGQSDWTSLPN